MSEVYTHRNGETEPPTIGGWYWATGKRSGWLIPGNPVVYLAKKKYSKVLFVVNLDKPVAEVKARWWGPVTPPREQE